MSQRDAARAKLLATPEPEILAFVESATDAQLERIVALGLVCRCEPFEFEDEDGKDYVFGLAKELPDGSPGFTRCTHITKPTLSAHVQQRILARLWPEEYEEPTAIAEPTNAMSQMALTRVRARRFAAGQSLWNDNDLVNSTFSVLDYLGRLASRKSNGHVETGPLQRIDYAGQ